MFVVYHVEFATFSAGMVTGRYLMMGPFIVYRRPRVRGNGWLCDFWEGNEWYSYVWIGILIRVKSTYNGKSRTVSLFNNIIRSSLIAFR